MRSKVVAFGSTFLMLFLALAAVTVFAPVATAQGEQKLQLFVDTTGGFPKIVDGLGPNGRIRPEIDEVKIEYHFYVIVPSAQACLKDVIVTWTANRGDASWATIILNKPSESQPVPNPGGQSNVPPVTSGGSSVRVPTAGSFSTTVTVKVSREAPAFKEGTYTVVGQAAKGETTGLTDECSYQESLPQDSPVTVKNDFVPRISAIPSGPQSLKTGQNKNLLISVTVQNLGNYQVQVKPTTKETSKGKLDALLVPPEQPVASKIYDKTAQDTINFIVTARTPHKNGYTNTVYSFTATFTARVDNPSETGLATDSKDVPYSIQVQGVYVPGFEPTSAIAAIGAALLLLGVVRRRTG